MRNRAAFTLIEVLISVALLSIVMLALYSSLDMQMSANKHLMEYLDRAIDGDSAVMTLYKDLLYSDGNLTIIKGDFDRLCLHNTSHSLHGLSAVESCWIVAKDENRLLRVEGNGYKLPAKIDDMIEVDMVMNHLIMFDITRVRNEVLVVVQRANEKAYTFLIQGVKQPTKKKKTKKKKKKKKPKAVVK